MSWKWVWVAALALPVAARAQHLIWLPEAGHRKSTCLYGEIQVVATGPTIYYCGCNWWPGKPAGGYTGIQDQGPKPNGAAHHNMIFSIWDTSPKLHPKVTAAERRTQFSRFGGEGTGAHTHLDYMWQVGQTYRFYVTKRPDARRKNTLTSLYFLDEGRHRWVHEATISNPNDGHESVGTFGGTLNAFLENWSGEHKSTSKLAFYRLWTGNSTRDLKNVTSARGDGHWGVIDGTFFLAEGTDANLSALYRRTGRWVKVGAKKILSVVGRTVSAEVVHGLQHLPKAPAVK